MQTTLSCVPRRTPQGFAGREGWEEGVERKGKDGGEGRRKRGFGADANPL